MSTIRSDADLKAAEAVFLRSVQSLPSAQHLLFVSCTSATRLLKAVKGLDAVVKSQRTSKQTVGRIQRLTEKLEPFFRVVDTLVQCDPIHAATVWGGLRFIIQIASQFTTFFDKLTYSLDRLAASFPFFEEVASMGSSPLPIVIEKTLINVYYDLFVYLNSILGIFFKKDGNSKGRMHLAGSIIWKSFDKMFDETIGRMEFHSKTIKDHLELLHIKGMNITQDALNSVVHDAAKLRAIAEAEDLTLKSIQISLENLRELYNKEARSDLIYRIRNWLSAPSFTTKYDEAIAQREDKTAQWIFARPEYKKWTDCADVPRESQGVDSPSSQSSAKPDVLWISGNPGSGKSVLAAAVVQDLKDSYPAPLVSYYFFSFTASDSTSAYRAILSQILHQRHDDDMLLDKFTFAMKFISHGQPHASHNELTELLTLCCEGVGPMYLILDGLDECEDNQGLIKRLSELSNVPSLKIALFSRPTITYLPKYIQGLKTISIGRLNHGDIELYLANKLSDIMEDDILPRGSCNENVTIQLALRADGMFLWAKLMIIYIQLPALSLSERLDAIMEAGSPEGLDDMFDRIAKVIVRNGKASQKLSRQVFTWLLYAQRELQGRELEETISIGADKPKELNLREFNDFNNSVIATCAGFVELVMGDKRQDKTDCCFRFIHASVREYLFEKAIPGNWPLAPSEAEGHVEISNLCLRYLIYSMPAQPLSGHVGVDVDQEDMTVAFPFSKYAATNWIYHLHVPISTLAKRQSLFSPDARPLDGYKDLLSTMIQFLSQPRVLMAWIECCYTYKHIPSLVELRNWSTQILLLRDSLLQHYMSLSGAISEMLKFADYLEELEQDWGSSLLKTPGCIWEEVTAFSPSPLLTEASAIKFHSFESNNIPAAKSGRIINKISQTTLDGTFSAVLSIWTSNLFDDFEKLRKTNAPIGELFETLKYSSGWIAKYEVFCVKSHERVAFVDIPIEPSEIWLQLSQTLLRDKLQFPLSIGRDASCFTVLRTFYMLRSQNQMRVLECKSEILPLPMTEENESYWAFPSTESGRLMLDDYYRFKDHQWKRVYLYWIYFDEQNQCLCFIDQIRAAPTNFIVFRIQDRFVNTIATRPTVIARARKWLKSFSSQCVIGREYGSFDQRDEKLFELAFHPYLSILAVTSRVGVFLWKFDDQDKMLTATQRFNGQIPIPNFSECGQYCIISNKQLDISPIVLDLTSNQLFGDVLGAEFRKKINVLPIESQNTTPYTGSQLEISAIPSQFKENGNSIVNVFTEGSSQKSVIRGTSLSKTSDGSQSIIQLANTKNSIELQKQWTNELGVAENESLTLTLLPNWPETKSLQSHIVLPTTKDEPIRIVLDKTAETWNSMSGLSSDNKFPGVIERDRGTFRSPTARPDAILQGQQAKRKRDIELKMPNNRALPERSHD